MSERWGDVNISRSGCTHATELEHIEADIAEQPHVCDHKCPKGCTPGKEDQEIKSVPWRHQSVRLEKVGV